MRLEFVGRRHVELTAALRTYVERRLRFALGRFGGRIARVTVRFWDVNGHRGGVDKRCRLDVTVRPLGKVVVEDTAAQFHAAVDRAAERAARAIRRAVEQEREWREGPIRSRTVGESQS